MGRIARTYALIIGIMLFAPFAARADVESERKHKLMQTVHRVAIVAPLYGTDTLSRASALPKPGELSGAGSDKGKKTRTTIEEQNARLAAYVRQLHHLLHHAADILPNRIRERTPFTLVSVKEMDDALKSLELTPQGLFKDHGRIKGKSYPTPDAEPLRKLAASLHADAILLTVLDEPRRTNGHYAFNLLSGVDYNSAHVESRGAFFVIMADGTQALHDFGSVVHPLTHLGNRQFLLVDWTEAEDLLIENFLDEWTRYTPEK